MLPNIETMTLSQIAKELESRGWKMEVEAESRSNAFPLPRWIRPSQATDGIFDPEWGVSYPQSRMTLEGWFRDALTQARKWADPAVVGE